MDNNTAEYLSVRSCTQTLVDGVVACGPETISDSLVSAGLISDNVYQAMTLERTVIDKGRELVQSLTATIKHSPMLFDNFLDVLSRNGADNLVKLLKDKCE